MSRKAEARKGQIAVPYLGGDLAAQRTQRTLEVLAQRLGLLGVLADPSMSIAEIVALQGVGGNAYKPLRVLLPEGTWSFGAAGVTVARDNVHFEAVGNGYTVFQRTVVAVSAPLITFTGAGCRLVGVRISDAASDQPAVLFQNRHGTIASCRFEDCWRALRMTGASASHVRDNRILVQRDTTYQMHFFSGSHYVVVGNTSFSTVGLTVIRADDVVVLSTFTANTCHGASVTYVLDYKTTGATLNAQAGNVGTVNAR